MHSLLQLVLLTALANIAATTPGVLQFDFLKTTYRSDDGDLRRRASSDNVINVPLMQGADRNEYLINITVGTPGQQLTVTLDTGSSDLWIPASSSEKCVQGACDGGSFDPTKSSTYRTIQPDGFNVSYLQANDTDIGDYGADRVTLGENYTIDNLEFGLVLSETVDTHGVLGLSYNATETGNDTYPNMLDQLKSQGLIERRAFSLWLNDPDASQGSVLFGGIDTTKFHGPLYALTTQPLLFGLIPVLSITLSSVSITDHAGHVDLVSPSNLSTNAILDSGTTLTYLPNEIFVPLVTGFGGISDAQQNTLVPCRFANSNITINYGFGGPGGPNISIPIAALVDARQQAIPPSHFSDPSGACPLLIGGIKGPAILGDSFLRSTYVVYDLDNNEIAIASAKVNVSSSSIQILSAGTGFPGVSSTATATVTLLTEVGQHTSEFSVAPTPRVSGSNSVTFARTPTFNLGPSATGSVQTTSVGSKSSSALAVPLQTGAVGVMALFGGAAAVANL